MRSDDGERPDEPVLAIAIEPGRLAAGLVDRRGNVLVRDRVSMPSRDVWRSLERLVRRVLAAAGTDGGYSAVGVSCVGPVDVRSGMVSPPHVPSWLNFTIVEHLEGLTGRPVLLDSAGGAAAEAERWLGEATSTPSFMAVVADAVVDSAVVLDGIRLLGSHGNAGAMAHSNVDPGGLECWCGSRGCLDPYVSAIALEAEMGRPLRRATPSIVERSGIMLGRAISSTAAMVDVNTAFVTGSVIDAFGDTVLEACRREIKRRSRLSFVNELVVIEPVEHISLLVRAASLAVGAIPEADRVTDR